jgi:hypothetical protein
MKTTFKPRTRRNAGFDNFLCASAENTNLNALNLDLAASGFSLRNAVALAQASAAAYDGASIQNELCHVRFLPQEDCLVVAFRGTHNLQDIMVDAEAGRIPLPGMAGSVHAGFWKSVESIVGQLVEVLQTPGNEPDLPLFITGHSKGGAEAMLAACILSRKLQPARIEGVYTFDQPRLFDAGARASYDRQAVDGPPLGAVTWRIVNGGDIVPQVPFWHWGYRHAGNEAFLPDCGSAVSDCGLLVNPRWDVTVVSKLNAYIAAFRRHKDVCITDHFITEIQARLEQEEAIRSAESEVRSVEKCRVIKSTAPATLPAKSKTQDQRPGTLDPNI